jgi:hypothetical protein
MKSCKQKQNLLPTFLAAKNLTQLSLILSLSAIAWFNPWCKPAQAGEMFGNEGVYFEQDTIIEFEFIQSHGAYQSTFGVIDLDSCTSSAMESCQKTPLLSEVKPADTQETVYRRSTYLDNASVEENYDFKGSPHDTVPKPLAEFEFLAGKRYIFYLESVYNGEPAGIVYSANFLNSANNQQALFNIEPPNDLLAVKRRNSDLDTQDKLDELINGGVMMRWDDTGSKLVRNEFQDIDFDDFIVGIGGEFDCIYPESEQ